VFFVSLWFFYSFPTHTLTEKGGGKSLNLQIQYLEECHIQRITASFQAIGWNKPVSQYKKYLLEQNEGKRTVLVALSNENFCGYLTINWNPDYPPFRNEGIPEIQDLNVLPSVRRLGIATRLMDEAEKIVAKRSTCIGIGVGLDADYGPAQRLYIIRGYIPDGKGLMYAGSPVKYDDKVIVNDELTLQLTKRLKA
jgi:ribosomal protein S18 acetylase RimI-like enzyme